MTTYSTALLRAMVLLTTVVAVFLLLASAVSAGGSAVETERYLVQRGDTLWELAGERTAPGGDVRPVVDQIRRMNELETSAITPGQTLLLPAR